MSDTLEIRTLGGLSVRRGGQPVKRLASRKAEALLVYLGMRPQAHSREALATLLWSDLPPPRALGNLSVLLTSLRKEIAPFLTIGPDSVSRAAESGWDLDAIRLVSFIEEGPAAGGEQAASRAEEALELYRGEFLEGFYLRGAPAFEEWAAVQRERLRHLVLRALHHLVNFCLQSRQYSRGLRHVQNLLGLDPVAEAAHRQAMILCIRLGDSTGALAVYESCRKSLKAELGIEPSIETRSLYHRILTARESAASNLPVPVTAFFGREAELARIAERLSDPQTRLITLVGPGGVGKTRLAIKAADDARSMFLDGACFVSLTGQGSPAKLASALTRALNLDLYGAASPVEQLQDYLREKELLVVWDGLEHLLDEVPLLTEILRGAPHVRFLVTSRQRLNLVGEWVFPLKGFPVPLPEEGSPEVYGAIRLFVHSVERAGGVFELSPETAPCAAEICRLVEGSPLAIELAAAWIRVLPCHEVAIEIGRNLDFLSASGVDFPDGHRSLRAVFDRSWELLGEEERRVLGAMSLFVGGFGREAADQVAGASVGLLTALLDKSLLAKSRDDRFEVHDLVRQFAAEKLGQDPARQGQVQARHSAYYAARLRQGYEGLSGGAQKSELAALGVEIENLRAAWNRSLDERWGSLITESLDGLWLFYERAGWNQEGEEAFGRAAKAWRSPQAAATAARRQESGLLLGRLLSRHGWFCLRLSQYDRAKEEFSAGQALVRAASDRRELAFSTRGLSGVAYRKGSFPESVALAEESLAFAEACGDDREAARSLNTLGLASIALGRPEQGRERLYESLEYFRKAGDEAAMSSPLHNLGISALWRGGYEEARRLLEESLNIRQEYGGPLAVAESINPLAELAAATGDYGQATELYEECLALSRQHGQRTYQVWSLLGLAHVAGATGRTADEETWAQECLRVVDEMGDRWGKANCLGTLAHIASVRGEWEHATTLAQESLALHREIEDPWGVVISLNRMGTLAVDRGNPDEGRRHYESALPQAVALGANQLALVSLAGIARTFALQGERQRAESLLAFCRQHPSASAETRSHVDQWLADVGRTVGENPRGPAPADFRSKSIEEVAQDILSKRSPG